MKVFVSQLPLQPFFYLLMDAKSGLSGEIEKAF
jgi:hypothetical protein